MSFSDSETSGAVRKADECTVVNNFDGERGYDYHEWKFTILRCLDYDGLRGFIDGTASLSPEATEHEKLEFMRKKISAYTTLRNSVSGWLATVAANGSYRDRLLQARFDNTYDAKRLWDVVHECCDEDVFN
ncbi:uncharacterized protein C8A04DRAFT_29948 [Dichotomopilus funicola]|uniref:Uncharacterized protein n=1 Tax=Dichotomopilus funicola TaxID=1934379 RepID=A0AAN6V0F3_9PEZI|nr:hypothetical protein C8A04DRAFT_29948 [Dichotomopilus funicola]